YGRDFTADGTIEAAEVHDGDPAPDGSGPLRLTRGMEMGHIFALGRKYAEALDLKVLDANGKAAVVTMGSYGIGVTRAIAAIAELHHDEKGLVGPRAVARPMCTSWPPARTRRSSRRRSGSPPRSRPRAWRCSTTTGPRSPRA